MLSNKIIIDGYNLIKSAKQDFPQSVDLAGEREHLIKILNSSVNLRNQQIIVIFDGRSDTKAFSAADYPNIRIIFSKNRIKADDIIQELIRKDSRPTQIELVSSDREIQFTAKGHGAKVTESKNFWRKIRGKPSQKGSQLKGESPTERDLSNKELKEWLKIFRDREAKNGKD